MDRLNPLAQNRRWEEWRSALASVPAHRDPKLDSYRLHNLAVANEAVAYEATDVEDWTTRLGRAGTLIAQASAANPKEKYITEASERLARSVASYRRLTELYQANGLSSLAAAPAAGTARPPVQRPSTPPSRAAAMTNQDVIDLRAAGLDDENLIAAIAEAKAVQFDLSPAGLKALLAAKVSNRVIVAMRSRTR